jgi:hypothetical protein
VRPPPRFTPVLFLFGQLAGSEVQVHDPAVRAYVEGRPHRADNASLGTDDGEVIGIGELERARLGVFRAADPLGSVDREDVSVRVFKNGVARDDRDGEVRVS